MKCYGRYGADIYYEEEFEMNCGIALFIYDRPQCTEKVLEALKRNNINELYVFQDGIGEKTNRTAWQKNEKLIEKIDWCKVNYLKNEYKASSLDSQIIYGINKIFEKKDEIIVVEDDCVISDDCIEFMERCLEKYRDNEKVIDVGAYLEPIRIPDDYSLPVIAAGIPSGQVWATWRNRWDKFQKEYSVIRRIWDSLKDNPTFDTCGYPIKRILTNYWMLGTWDLWWSIYVLSEGGIAVRPAGNKVYNIGFENPGTHTAGESPWVVQISDSKAFDKDLPDDLCIESWAEAEFGSFYRSGNGGASSKERQTYYRNCLEKWLDLKQKGKSIGDILSESNIKCVAVYGAGDIAEKLINDMADKIKVEYLVVTNKKADDFIGYKVYGCDAELPAESKEMPLIVIPGYDIEGIGKTMANKFKEIYTLDALFNIGDKAAN